MSKLRDVVEDAGLIDSAGLGALLEAAEGAPDKDLDAAALFLRALPKMEAPVRETVVALLQMTIDGDVPT